MATYNYQDLQVWQKAMELVEEVYKVTEQLPKTELFALSSQLKRAAVSIPSNIAEGQKRLNKAETIQFTGIALGSIAETETQLILCQRLHGADTYRALGLCTDVGKMSTALIRSLKASAPLRSKL